ncbi:TPA: hypothetical protein KQG29_001560 [Clostridioides difficile]|nr:hypothetical protein [Clostridioides difficile]
MFLLDNFDFINLTEATLYKYLKEKVNKYTYTYYKQKIKTIDDEYYDMYKSYLSMLSLSKDSLNKRLNILTHLDNKILDCMIKLPAEEVFNVNYSLKVKGFFVNLVYENGIYTDCNTLMKFIDKDTLTKCITMIVPKYVKQLIKYKTRILGYFTVSKISFEYLRMTNPNIKDISDAILFIFKNSSDSNIIKFLEFIVYDIYPKNLSIDSIKNNFNVVTTYSKKITKENFLKEIKEISAELKGKDSIFEYFSDGILITSNKLHNLPLLFKIDLWKPKTYSSIIIDIIWCYSSNGIIPIAEIEPLLFNNTIIKYINLYSPNNILILDAYEKENLNFLYLHDNIIVPTTKDGQLLLNKL